MCLRVVTADAMGMAKEGNKTEVDVDGAGSESGENTVRHRGVRRFEVLRRDNTPSPANLAISYNSGYNECSLSCLRGRRRGLCALLSPCSLSGG